jgi:hypothetical protein
MADREIIIHGGMVYSCRDCGESFVMYLERGLEEAGCEDRKPVPFGIICPFCHGFHAYDASGLLPLPVGKYAELPDGESYFANRSGRDCGVPVYAEHMRRLKEETT